MSTEFDYDNFKWDSVFRLDASSPSGLAWNKYTYSFGGRKLETWPGKPAGTLREVKNGDNKAWGISFTLNGKSKHFSVHRVVAVLSGLKVNGYVIDHINGISADNRIENLRVTTQAINSRNCKPQHNSPYGITGVGFYEDRVGNGYFIARAYIDGKREQKSFPIKYLGVMEAFRQAVVSRQQLVAELNASGAGYSSRHTAVSTAALEFDTYKVTSHLIKKATRSLSKRVSNTSGVTGVSWECKSNCHALRAVASWNEYSDNSKFQRTKSFSVKKYGLLPAFAMAVQCRKEAIKRLNDLGYGYTDNHGQ